MKSTNIRPYKVFAIKAGTVIDHITAGHALKIVRLLNLADENRVVTIGLNFSSKKMKLKDIIKVENRELTKEEINRLLETLEIMGNSHTLAQITDSEMDIKAQKIKVIKSVRDL